MTQKNILEYIEETVKKVPHKKAYSDGEVHLSFQQVSDYARSIGTFLHQKGYEKEPVVVFMKRSPQTIASFWGTVYSGCFYIPIDEEMPKYRIELIFQNLKPRALICDETTVRAVPDFQYEGECYLFDEITAGEADQDILAEIRKGQIDTDPVYVLFTSGSTGIPKGVTACHRSLIDYIENLSDILGTTEETVFGNQAPLYFDACLKDIVSTIKSGATTYLIPKSLFMFPIKLMEYLNTYKINTVGWVASALAMVSGLGVLDKLKPEHLHMVAFGSEVFPVKQFQMWKKALPDAKFINIYGPTECTGLSCYYIVDRDFALDERIPIGKALPNKEIILLNEENRPAASGETGEICIRGTAVALGYYRDFERTREVFVQNPLNDRYPELIYRTGDLGMYNERGELVFVSRKDYQIKHMGHRIELGEIEMNANMLEKIRTSGCIYDEGKGKIVLYYTGDLETREVVAGLKDRLPRYMIPNIVKKLEEMPLTATGKIDRVSLKERFAKEKDSKRKRR